MTWRRPDPRRAPRQGQVACPCCGHRTLPSGPGDYEVCPVCDWEDDGQPPWTVDGPHGGTALVEAQQRFLATPAWRRRLRRLRRWRRPPGLRGREPRPEEARDPGWRPIEVTDELLARIDRARAEQEREWEQARLTAEEPSPGDERMVAFNAELEAMVAVAGELSHAELVGRHRALCAAYGMFFPVAEAELFAHLLQDPRWPWRHPLAALGWAWRHRHEVPLRSRARQALGGSVRFTG